MTSFCVELRLHQHQNQQQRNKSAMEGIEQNQQSQQQNPENAKLFVGCDGEGGGGAGIANSLGNVQATINSEMAKCNMAKGDSHCEAIEKDNDKKRLLAATIRNGPEATIRNGTEIACCAAFDEDSSDGREKSDVTPENLKKIDDVIGTNSSKANKSNEEDQNLVDYGNELRIVEDESPSKQSQALAFTIDFNEGASGPLGTTATKYKNMIERFQSRHKRGVSMSKLECPTPQETAPAPSERPSRLSSASSGRQSQKSSISDESQIVPEATKVKIRIRDRSTSGVRDANKRHSWSPRSSTQEQIEFKTKSDKLAKQAALPVAPSISPAPQTMAATTNNIKSKPYKYVKTTKIHDEPAKSSAAPPTTSSFTPRSTAMQMALNKIELGCPEPLLDDLTLNKHLADDESVSEAGTYTVDGDNYTEEQKELMNIDKSKQQNINMEYSTPSHTDTGQCRPKNLSLMLSTTTPEDRRRNNVLEVSYYHDAASMKPKISYLDKIKSRVKSITKSPDKKLTMNPSMDQGTFTSVTTSGVLSKRPTLDAYPKLNRKNSLTKSLIDSSEYISGENRFKSESPTYPNAFTDIQKAEYKLSVFTSHTDSRILDDCISYDAKTPVTPDSPVTDTTKLVASETGLKTAQTKSDWIQEWARNARRANKPTVNNQMSRSYDFEMAQQQQPVYSNKTLDRFRNRGLGDYEYSSETDVAGHKQQFLDEFSNNNGMIIARPPLSPSKIPSPMHTVGRARSASRTRGSLQDLSPSNFAGPDTDIYLQKTAAVISNLTQSLSRKNSLQSTKSPNISSTNSPRRLRHHNSQQQHYSADEYSPIHSSSNSSTHYNTLHKRNLSFDYRNNLMSHSLNSDALGGHLDSRQHRHRQHSFDATIGSPNRYYQQKVSAVSGIDQTELSNKQQSPIRRSSSFSTKPYGSSGGNNQSMAYTRAAMQKAFTPRPTMSNDAKIPIQKSASSTSFKKVFSDYDTNAEYYINDDDDLINDYYSSDEFDEPMDSPFQDPEPEPPEPITNTRYNKALLMRIERSKQKVAGNPGNANQAGKGMGGGGGVMACPNTPEMPRRAAQTAARSSMRQSVPRDSSLNRLRGEVPNSLASAKKQLLQTAATPSGKKVQPKYMDISKYKPAQGAHFLRKDESKSTLVSRPEIRRSPSSASVTMGRSDPTRASNRSIKSAGCRPNSGNSAAQAKRDAQIPKQKEAELAMWKRRATYDPMKAALEGKRKQEEAKKQAQMQSKASDRASNENEL